jgi:hypothetical protein
MAAREDRGKERLRCSDLVGIDALVAHKRLLDGVLGLADAAEHPVSDRE